MNLKEYQKQALKTAIYPNIGKNWVYPILGLVGEAGEIANKLKKAIRDYEFSKTEIELELGDLMWYVVVLCHELKIDPDLVLELNIDKLEKRIQTKTISGSGDHRELDHINDIISVKENQPPCF